MRFGQLYSIFLLFLYGFISISDCCMPWTYGDWHSWSSCTESCGGGTRQRYKLSCVKSDKKYQKEECNEFCYNGGSYHSGNCHCKPWRRGSCCQYCSTSYYIPHCISKECGGSPDNIRCSRCENPFYSGGFGKGCKECTRISNCKHRHCTSAANTVCDECNDDNVFYKRTHSNTRCERMCSFDTHKCWPGECSNKLTSTCVCASDFHLVKSSSETSCQLQTKPSINNCQTTVFGSNGEKKRTNAGKCHELKDIFGNFNLTSLTFSMMSDLTIDMSKLTKPHFISESNFGITDTRIVIKHIALSGAETYISIHNQTTDINSSMNVNSTVFNDGNILLGQAKYTLTDGERLCFQYEAYGGGYVKAFDFERTSIMNPFSYKKTKSYERVCYKYDAARPKHCLISSSCPMNAKISEPLHIKNRIIRSPIIPLEFKGWYDPLPAGGRQEHASGIESFEIRVNEVSNGIVGTKKLFSKQLKATETSLTLNLSSETPKLYCITLEVKDEADNVQQARRFVLYDNTTFITTRNDKKFTVTSASVQTNYTWQTHHHDICLNWKDHFYNKFYMENNFFKPISSDPNKLIKGLYEQENGQLPVSGTHNLFGITSFNFSWSLNGKSFSPEIVVPDFLNQTYCHRLSMSDGQTYTVNIKAIDILNNTFLENRTVHIDRTVPHINNIGLEKRDEKRLFVHDDTDLSQMRLIFDALDPHSGLLNIQWKFGTSDAGHELGSGAIGIHTINHDHCPKEVSKCYCPDIGNCERYNYSISLNSLVKNNTNKGNHNRNYYFTIKVTNKAMLSNIEHVDILVDNSPPEVGVIYEGAVGTSDIDYTSDNSFIVRWHGFIDHESGIKEYYLGLSDSCKSKEQLFTDHETSNITEFIKVPHTESSVRLNANFTGKMYVSIIAINNAHEASDVVCSDGITRDNTPPNLKNVRIEHGRWSESLYCLNGQAWLFRSDLQKNKLANITGCSLQCHANTHGSGIFEVLPTIEISTDDKDIGEFRCKNLPLYNHGNIIYLPNNHIYLSWEIEEPSSQVEEYYVGFGLTSSNASVPSFMDYITTNGKQYFEMRHIGASAGELLYTYIKTVNKAKLEKVTKIGPILIDETPPYFDRKPTVHIDKNMVTTGWDRTTVYDLEQATAINQVFFQIVHDNDVVSPFLEWRLEDSKPCLNFTGGCMKYPLKRLQRIDTDVGLNFAVRVYAYNNAGHFAIEETDAFKIPSRYPPGHAVVKDIDPESNSSSVLRDVDVHFTASKLCVQWYGFRHHENVNLEIGIGANNNTADIIPFQFTNASNTLCVKSKSLQYNTKYFVLLRATCTGGKTISSSDGIIIVNATEFLNSFDIHVGGYAGEIRWKQQGAQNTSQKRFCAPKSVKLGDKYKLFFEGLNRKLTIIKNADMVIDEIKYNNLSMKMTVNMVPLTERPCLIVDFNASSNATLVVYTRNDNDNKFISDVNTFFVTWAFERYKEMLSHLMFEVAVGKKFYQMNTTNNNLVTAFTKSDSDASHTFHFPLLPQEHEYIVIIRPCTNVRCIDHVYSNTFEIESSVHSGKFQTFQIELNNEKTCVDVTLEWKMFKAKSSVTIYQWSVSKDHGANIVLTRWRTVLGDGRVLYNVTECIHLPVLGHSTLYLCVRAYSRAGNVVTICERASVVEKSEFNKDTIYDIDASVTSWNVIQQMIHSSNIGSKYSVLHDAEMDFGTTNTSVVGTLMYATERNVTWYLMKNKHLPVLEQCDKDSECVFSTTTGNGYVLFDKSLIKQNVFYYTCAFSNASSVSRELFTEILSEIRTCSNGFIIDNTPPFGGQLNVKNTGGFIIRPWKMDISWNGFDDNVNTEKLGYSERIKFYSYAVGTRPGSEDIKIYTVVGNAHRAVVRNLDIKDGTGVYVAVKATDHAGLSTEIYSNELTIDSTPPRSGTVGINGNKGTSIYISSSTYELTLSGFNDDQSGIEYFELATGSDEDLEDVQPKMKYFSDHIELELLDNMQDGHQYYISVKAVNRAGLSSMPATVSFIPDRSAPTGGHVLDGDWRTKKDLDFQKNLGYIQGHWKGFTDSHSGVKYYRAGLGTKPYQDDIEVFVDVGLQTDITWNGTYEVGTKYYITVEACNRAGTCRSLSSDGVVLDNSPPVHGIVKVGSSVHHHKYLPTGDSVHISWYGFEDPQSGIDHYEYCLGTKPLLCNVLSFSSGLLQSGIIKTGLNLTNEHKYYATVIAFNKAGLDVKTASDAFCIDDTPPVLVQKPTFLLDYNAVSGLSTQWDRSVLRVSWKFVDGESKVASHKITLKTHHEGHTPVEQIHIGNVEKLTISLDEKNWLHNGDKYFVVVTSCNTAGLCSASKSDSLLIDASPPHQGGFKPPMTWHNLIDASHQTRSEIMVTWYGFVDAESPINKYYFTVSRNYSGQELSGGVLSRVADLNEMEQNTTITLNEALVPDELLILTIWAKNSAGLNSTVSRVTVNVLLSEKKLSLNSSGILELQKHSCDIHYCNKDCTCAVFGSPCVEVQTKENCTTLNEVDVLTMKLPEIDVYGGLYSNPQNITASSACLSGYWVPRGDDRVIQRYEWSMGIKNQPVGEGIFDLKSERPWKDVGKRMETVYCLSHIPGLQHDIEYQVYVRAWYAWNMFAEFVSPPIQVDQTAPHHVKGKHIKDSDAKCLQDYDVIDWMDTISACWDKVFTELQGEIIHYIISLGTSINGSDVYETTNVGLVTSITLTNLSLSHGTRYYFTITAYNNVGLHTTLSSDGFVIDMDRPITGVVFNTDKHLDTAYQSSATTFGISWHGFLDQQSGIKSYLVAVVEKSVADFENISFLDVGLKTMYEFRNITFKQAQSYKGLVKAIDFAGHTSDVVSSNPKIIDVTAPKSFDCVKYQTEILNTTELFLPGTISFFKRNITRNDYYEIRGYMSGVSISVMPTLVIDRYQMHLPVAINSNSSIEFQYNFLSTVSGSKLFNISTADPSLAENNFSMNVEFKKCITDKRNAGKGVDVRQIGSSRLAINIKVKDEESSLYKVMVGVGTTQGGFQASPLTVLNSASGDVIDVDVQHGAQIFVTVLAENHAGLRSVFKSNPITIDKTPPGISRIEGKLIDNHSEMNQTVRTFNLLAKWDVADQQSGLKYCLCGIGKVKGEVDIERYRLSDTNETCVFRQLELQHGDTVFVSVKCINNIELAAENVSEKITVYNDAPENTNAYIRFISHDSSTAGASFQSPNESDVSDIAKFIQTDRSHVVLEWTGFEDLTGIDFYEYRLVCRNSSIVNWRSNGKHTAAELKGLDLQSGGLYTAEVRAVNSGHLVSEPVVADMIVHNHEPKLTGKPISVTGTNQRLLLDWSDVFRLSDGISVTYDVMIGSKLGFSDILELKSIEVNQYDVTVPKTTIITPNVQELFISISCTYSTGLFTQYKFSYKL
ncbi:uncharacterized protein LOC123555884 isoform X2 [Mercenaria mercenaria]|uniref:uncharacterized protein LOC123555884 isoform X2 n=1 Tax=Mercenaria mercenaria TaxID=6596 RepID=UPI00234F412B|nr:uncharacterized protein LOC123555884 isoform X2 [Mercenaria mercenaria]